MTVFESLPSQPYVQAFGWALVHFLWQGTLLAILLAVLLILLKRQSATSRYLAACAVLVLMLAFPVLTTLKPLFAWQSVTARATPGSESQSVRLPQSFGPETAGHPSSPPVRDSQYPIWAQVVSQIDNLVPLLLIVWCFGVLLLSLKFAGGFLYARRLTRRAVRPLVSRWQATVAELKKQMQVSRPVRLLESRLAQVPMAIGWLRPVILLPASALTGLSEAQLRALIIHELAHIRRCDYLVNLLQVAMEILFFYHPAVWWVSRQVRIEREHCCDDLAVIACGDAFTYARALTEMERLRQVTPQLVVAANGGMLMNRIRRIVGVPTRRANRFAGSPAVILAMVTVFLGAIAQVNSIANATVPEPIDVSTYGVSATENRAAVVQPGDGNASAQAEQSSRVASSNARPADAATSPSQSPTAQSPSPSFPADVMERLQALKSADPAARAAAACFLGRTREVNAIAFLIDLLGDEAVIEARPCWENSTWSPALQSLKKPSPGEQAAIALASLGEPAVQPLINALQHANPTVRSNAAWAIGEVTGGLGVDRSNAVLPLLAALKDESLWVRKAAAFSLGELRDRRATNALMDALEDGSAVVRDMAARALGEMKAKRAVEPLMAILLKDEQWGVRNRAAWALGEIKDPLAVEALNQALNDVDLRVRRSVKTALSEILD